MSSHAMPFLIYNLGGEMIYILEQRLDAQKIETEKSRKVLIDVAEHMFNESFQHELMKPQPLYSNISIREIFDRLAHSSIMRLSSSSMDKLYDLMTMGLKFNVLQCSQPQEVLQMTLNHLDSIAALIGDSPKAKQYIQIAIDNVLSFAEHFTLYDWNRLRSALLDFMQDRNIKVSLFLNANLQNRQDGTFILEFGDYPLGFEAPGNVKVFDENGTIVKTFQIQHPYKQAKQNEINHLDVSKRTSKYGFNCYIDQKRLEEESKERSTITLADNSTKSNRAPQTVYYSPSSPYVRKKQSNDQDMNYLAKLIGVSSSSATKGTFKIENLFPESKEVHDDGHPVSYQLHFEDISPVADLKTIMDEFTNLSTNVSTTDDQEDLLSLMDNV